MGGQWGRHRFLWVTKGFYGLLWGSMGLYEGTLGALWVSMGLSEMLWGAMGLYGVQ